jgi:D-alanine transaminase
LNGEYLPLAEARVSPLDRAFLFGDAVYEVMPVYGGRPFRFAAHCERLTRSLGQLGMEDPRERGEWRQIVTQLIERNGRADLYIYWQVTRGMEYGRNHAPFPNVPRTVFAFCAPLPVPAAEDLAQGLSCVTAADNRWERCDIKSTALLANLLLRQAAVDAGAAETILLRDGELTEGSASAVHVVIDGELRTPQNSPRLLPGTTRGVIEELATRIGVAHRSMPISERELRGAEEIMLSAATRELSAVTRLDGRPVGRGQPGPIWQRLYAALQRYKQELAGEPW